MITIPRPMRVRGTHPRHLGHRAGPLGGQVYSRRQLNAQVGLSGRGLRRDCHPSQPAQTFAFPMAAAGGGPRDGRDRRKSASFRRCRPGIRNRWRDAHRPVSRAVGGAILTISYISILMMGGEGLTPPPISRSSTPMTSPTRLDPHFPVLYRNARGRVAHECSSDRSPAESSRRRHRRYIA